MGIKGQPARLRALIIGKTVLAAVVLAWLGVIAPPTRWPVLLLLLAVGLVAGVCKVDANVRNVRITMSFTISFFTFLFLGTTEALMVNVLGMLASIAIRTAPDGRRRLRPKRLLSYQVLYNAANSVLAHAAMGAVFL